MVLFLIDISSISPWLTMLLHFDVHLLYLSVIASIPQSIAQSKYYALINRARGPYEEIFVPTFKAYGLNACAVRSMRVECQTKYFPYGPKSLLITAILYTYTNKIVLFIIIV